MSAENRNNNRNQKSNEKGVALIAAVLTVAVLFGMLGLCFDLARIYIAKNELQTFADAATMAATAELDGTDEGLTQAKQAALSFPNKWLFGTKTVPTPSIFFAKEVEGPWVAVPPSPPSGYRFAEVVTSGTITLYFMPIFDVLRGGGGSLQGGETATLLPHSETELFASTSTPFAFLTAPNFQSAVVQGRGAAGQLRVTNFKDGLLPYSPKAHLDGLRGPVYNPGITEPDPFNFVRGAQYTIRWPPPGQSNDDGVAGNSSNGNPGRCSGDFVNPPFVPPVYDSDRGFIDIGWSGNEGNSSSTIRQAIVSNAQSHSITIGDPVVHVSGQRTTENAALEERIAQDSDRTSTTYAQYSASGQGNWRRIVYMPVNNPFDANKVVQFATFFLPPANQVCGSDKPNSPCCAEYVGPGLLGRGLGADDEVGVFMSRLIQ